MPIIRWIVKHKFLLVVIYTVTNILLHIPLFFMEGDLGLAILAWLIDFPAGIIYNYAVGILDVSFNISLDAEIAIQGLLSLFTNSLIIVGLLALVGKIFKVNVGTKDVKNGNE